MSSDSAPNRRNQKSSTHSRNRDSFRRAVCRSRMRRRFPADSRAGCAGRASGMSQLAHGRNRRAPTGFCAAQFFLFWHRDKAWPDTRQENRLAPLPVPRYWHCAGSATFRPQADAGAAFAQFTARSGVGERRHQNPFHAQIAFQQQTQEDQTDGQPSCRFRRWLRSISDHPVASAANQAAADSDRMRSRCSCAPARVGGDLFCTAQQGLRCGSSTSTTSSVAATKRA